MFMRFPLTKPANVKLAFLPSLVGVDMRITAVGENEQSLLESLSEAEKIIRSKADHFIYAVDDKTLAEVVAQRLLKTGKTIATAESCTGGLLAHNLTNVSGSSKYFERGVITYSNRAKEEILNSDIAFFPTLPLISTRERTPNSRTFEILCIASSIEVIKLNLTDETSSSKPVI